MPSYSQQRRTAWIKDRAWLLAQQDPFNGAPDPVAAATGRAEFEWCGQRKYDSTEIIRTDSSGRTDPDGGYATIRAIAAGSIWSTTYTFTELEELGIEIAIFLQQQREGDQPS
jgi:hypothetical protein